MHRGCLKKLNFSWFNLIFLLIITILINSTEVKGQNILLKGSITDTNKTPLPFVNIVIKSYDSIPNGTLTDMQGNFEFKNIKPQKYIVMISYLGFEKYKETIDLKNKDTLNLNIILKTTSKNLSEVVVQGKLIEQYADKNVYNITQKDTKTASAAFDVLKILPKLNIDFVNNNITTISGKSIKILINGMNASAKELLTMKPEDIAKIEYFDIVPTRFASEDIGAVINIITKQAIQGDEFFINSRNAVTTGFSDENLMYKFVKNNNQISLNYDFGYRNYKKRLVTENDNYIYNGENINRLEQGINSPFYYQTHNFDIKFLNQKQDNYIFCVDLISSLMDGNLTQNQNIFINKINLNQVNSYENASNELNPSINIYYDKKIKNQQEISINVVPTYYNDSYKTNLLQKKASDTILNINSDLKSKKYSLISEALYSKNFKLFKCNAGFIYSNNFSYQSNNSSLSAIENQNSILTNYYYYVEIVGKIKKASYNFGIGNSASVFRSKELDIKFKTQTLKPRITLQYDLNDFSNFKLTSSISPQSPSLSDLSNYIYYNDSIMAQRGNPNLKPYKSFNNSLEYNIAKSKYEFSLSIYYYYLDKPYLPFIEKLNNIYVQTSENFKWEKDIQPQIYFKLNLFKKQWLQFAFSYTLQYFENNNIIINYFTSRSINANITANYKNYTFDIIYYDGGKYLSGEYISKNEEALMIQLQYKYKKAAFIFGILQPFSKSLSYESYLVKSSVLNQDMTSNIYDNGNMFYIKFVYNLSFGKKANDADIKLYNKDYDSGVFKAK